MLDDFADAIDDQLLGRLNIERIVDSEWSSIRRP
jgi:hypothetical protein